MESATTQPGFRELWTEFREGATRPSLLALAGCLVVTALLILSCFHFLDEDVLAGRRAGYFYENSSDEYAALTTEGLRLRKEPPGDPVVIYFGASSMREALTGAKNLQELLAARTGRSFRVRNLSAGGLTFWEMMALTDNLPETMEGCIVIPVSPTTLTRRAERLRELTESPRLALDSPSLDKERELAGIPVPRTSGNFFRDNYRFFVARFGTLLANLVKGPPRVRKHLMDGSRPLSPGEWKRAIETRARWIDTYVELRPCNLFAYERWLGRIGENPHWRVILVGGLWNPVVEKEIMARPGARKTYAVFLDDVRQMTEQYGAEYLDVSGVCDFTPEDFVDTAHITNPEARACFTGALADRLAPILEGFQRTGGAE